MTTQPRRGSRLRLECSCEGRVIDWAITPWADRLYVVSLIVKGERCRIDRHRVPAKVSVRKRLGSRPAKYYDTLRRQ
jgi:hypothetical protein